MAAPTKQYSTIKTGVFDTGWVQFRAKMTER